MEIEDLADLRARLANARVAHLATAGPGGPHVVPITFALTREGLYSAIDWKPKSGRHLRRLENIRADPRVAVLVDHYEDDWRRLWWVRVDGTARILTSGPERSLALAALVEKYEQYRRRPPAGEVVAVTPERWSGWTGEGSGR